MWTMFYLLDGELTGFCEDSRSGQHVFVPRDRRHGFTVTSAGPARGSGHHRAAPARSKIAAASATRRVTSAGARPGQPR